MIAIRKVELPITWTKFQNIRIIFESKSCCTRERYGRSQGARCKHAILCRTEKGKGKRRKRQKNVGGSEGQTGDKIHKGKDAESSLSGSRRGELRKKGCECWTAEEKKEDRPRIGRTGEG